MFCCDWYGDLFFDCEELGELSFIFWLVMKDMWCELFWFDFVDWCGRLLMLWLFRVMLKVILFLGIWGNWGLMLMFFWWWLMLKVILFFCVSWVGGGVILFIRLMLCWWWDDIFCFFILGFVILLVILFLSLFLGFLLDVLFLCLFLCWFFFWVSLGWVKGSCLVWVILIMEDGRVIFLFVLMRGI